MADRKPAGRWKENEIDVHEYQAMELLVRFWRVTIARGAVAFSPDQAIYAATWAAGIGPRRRKFMRGKAGGSKNAGHITKSTKPRELCSENDSSPLRPVAKENPFSASMSRWPIRMTPSEAEVTKARRILEAMDQAAKEGKGAVALEGRLIDIASIRMAEALLTKANGKPVDMPGGSFSRTPKFAILTCGERCFYIFRSSERRTVWPGRHPF